MPKSAVMIGAMVGAASVVVAVLYFQPQIFDPAREPYATVTVEGLKGEYRVGEPVEFAVRIEGYGCDAGFPSVYIATTGDQTVWSRFGELRHFPAGVGCQPAGINQVREIGEAQKYDTSEQERWRTQGGVPIVMDREGTYVIHAEGGNARGSLAIGQFTVR